jgi:hypothetical protein
MKRFLLLLVFFGEMPAAMAQSSPAHTPAAPAVPEYGEETLVPPVPQARKNRCHTPLGQFVDCVTAPLRLVSGALSRDCCTEAQSHEELARMTLAHVSPAEATAAKIKAEEAGAKARRAAVRYLGTVDCHYYPETEFALIAGLRADRNESVRQEAALALANGCCSTSKTLAALNLVVTGSDADGNPSETSERVKAAAMTALQQFVARGVGSPPAQLPQTLPAVSRGAPSNLQRASYTEANARGLPSASLAERTFAETFGAPTTTPVRSATVQHNLFQRWVSASSARTAPELPPAPPPAARGSTLAPLGLTPIGVVPGQ